MLAFVCVSSDFLGIDEDRVCVTVCAHLAHAGWLFSPPDSEGLSQESARKIKSLAIHIAQIENSSPYPLDWDLDRSGAENYPHHFHS